MKHSLVCSITIGMESSNINANTVQLIDPLSTFNGEWNPAVTVTAIIT